MASIRDIRNPWRDKLRPASFKGAIFNVETNVQVSGRRVVVHEYPKRNDPYSEDMGRTARRFNIQGWLIGVNYLTQADALVAQLQSDGPGLLRLPFPIYDGQAGDMLVMAGDYNMTQTREHGGFAEFEMTFSEYGTPGFSVSVEDTEGRVFNAAASLEAATARELRNSTSGSAAP